MSIFVLVSFIAFADEPAAERETDLPAGLVDALNGINLPKGLPDLISDWATKTISDKNKRCFFNSFAKLLEILEDENLNSTLGKLGYTLWKDDKLHISGFFNENTTLTPNEVMAAIYQAVDSRLKYAIETKTYDSRSLEDCAKDEYWTDGFQLDYSIVGFDVFSTDYYIDCGDLNIIIAAMRVLRAGLQFLYAQNLNNMTIPEMINMIGGFAGDGTTVPSFVEVFTRVSEFLKKVSVRSPPNLYKSNLTNAQKFIVEDGVIPDMKRGDKYICESRVDANKHLFGRLTETGEPAHAIAYDPNNSIIALIRDHAADLKKLFTKTGDEAPLVYTSWFKGVIELPDWLERDSYRVTLAPVFSTTLKWANILPQFDGEWLKPESVTDPTFGGILPNMPADEMKRMLSKLALAGFDECPAIAEHVNTPEAYEQFRAWASKFSRDDVIKLRASAYAYQSYEMRAAAEPHVFENEPKVEISEVSAGATLQIKVKVTDGDSLVKAVQAIEESVQTCSNLASGSWGKATATAAVNADGTATITVNPPSGAAGFVRVKVL